jgi:DnaJ family protein C protein 17
MYLTYIIMLQDEIERLRKEGSKQVQQEREYVQQQIIQERLNKEALKEDCSHHRLRVRWTVAEYDPDNGGYSNHLLNTILSKVA